MSDGSCGLYDMLSGLAGSEHLGGQRSLCRPAYLTGVRRASVSPCRYRLAVVARCERSHATEASGMKVSREIGDR